MEKKKSNFKTYIYAIIAVLSFIAVSIGTTFAFFVMGEKSETDRFEIGSTANVTAMFKADNAINSKDIVPGYKEELKFSILNTSVEENTYGNYTLAWEIITNEIDDDSFGYTLVGNAIRNGNNVVESETNKVVQVPVMRKVPTVSSSIGTGTINTGVTHNYVLTLIFENTDNNQDNLRGKAFNGKVFAKGDPNI